MHEIKEYINEQVSELLYFVTKAKDVDDKHKAYYNGQLLAYKDVLNQIEMRDKNHNLYKGEENG